MYENWVVTRTQYGFTRAIKPPKGIIFMIYFKKSQITEVELDTVTYEKEIAITSTTVNGLTGNIHEAQSQKIITHFGYTLKREKMIS